MTTPPASHESLREAFLARDSAITAAIYAALGAACTRIPLLNILGYESSLLFAAAGSLAAMLLTARHVLRLHGEAGVDPTVAVHNTLRRAGNSIIINLVLLLIPLFLLVFNALAVRNCSLPDGVKFFLLLPCVSVVFTTALTFFCCMQFRHPRLAVMLVMVATFCYAAALGYWTPAIYSYNFFYGYFPGFTHDEGLHPSLTLLTFRCVTLALAAMLFWMGALLLRNTGPDDPLRAKGAALGRLLSAPGRRVMSLVIIAGMAVLWWFRCDLGYEATASFIQRSLGGVLKTDHFVIYYPRALYDEQELQQVADEHEFRLKEVMDLMALPRTPVIESYIYPSPDEKLRLIGAGNSDFTKPWTNQVHISAQSLFSTLQHELVHAVAGRFGRPVIKVSFSMGLTEGLATAVDWNWGTRTLHVYAASMRALHIAPDITRLMTPVGFVSQPSQVSYVLAGSFCRYLLDRYGIRKLLDVYGSEDYQLYYGRPLPVLVGEWQDFLSRVELDRTDLIAAQVLFRQPAIFAKPCARVIGERNSTAARAMASSDYAVAESLYARSYEEGRGYESLTGWVTAALRSGRYDTVLAVLDRAMAAEERPERLVPLSLQRGDALWALGRRREAFDAYRTLRLIDLSERMTEAAGLRMLSVVDDTLQATALKFFLTPVSDSARLAMIQDPAPEVERRPVLHLIRGRALLRMHQYRRAAQELNQGEVGDRDPALEALRLQSLGLASYEQGRYDEGRIKFWLSLNWDDSAVAEHNAASWIERCEWKKEHAKHKP